MCLPPPATIPTVGDAIEALNSLCDDLAATLKQIADVSAELSSRDHIRVDNIQEVVRMSDPAFLQDLDIAQKRSLIHQAYQRLVAEFQDEVKTVFGMSFSCVLRPLTLTRDDRYDGDVVVVALAASGELYRDGSVASDRTATCQLADVDAVVARGGCEDVQG